MLQICVGRKGGWKPPHVMKSIRFSIQGVSKLGELGGQG